jgi:uncharacterized protein
MRRVVIFHRMILLAAALTCGAVPRLVRGGAANDTTIPNMRWGVKIPMRDGVALNATLFLPRGQKDPVPVIFTLTPYIGDSYTDRAMYFAQHG